MTNAQKNKAKKRCLALLKKTYCRLQPSGIEGVGVFAIRDIPKNVDPFGEALDQECFKFTKQELSELNPPSLKKMLKDFFITNKDGSMYIPENGFNNMDISFYLNHSSNPSMKAVNRGERFITLRRIRRGEELTVDYATYESYEEYLSLCRDQRKKM